MTPLPPQILKQELELSEEAGNIVIQALSEDPSKRPDSVLDFALSFAEEVTDMESFNEKSEEKMESFNEKSDEKDAEDLNASENRANAKEQTEIGDEQLEDAEKDDLEAIKEAARNNPTEELLTSRSLEIHNAELEAKEANLEVIDALEVGSAKEEEPAHDIDSVYVDVLVAAPKQDLDATIEFNPNQSAPQIEQNGGRKHTPDNGKAIMLMAAAACLGVCFIAWFMLRSASVPKKNRVSSLTSRQSSIRTGTPNKIGIVNIKQILLRSEAGQQLKRDNKAMKDAIGDASNREQELARINKISAGVIEELLNNLRRLIKEHGLRENYAIILGS